MKYLKAFLIGSMIASLAIILNCSKKAPTEPEPTDFTLYVQNDTPYDVGVVKVQLYSPPQVQFYSPLFLS